MKLSGPENTAITAELEALYARMFKSRPTNKAITGLTFVRISGDEGVIELYSHVYDSDEGPLSQVSIFTKKRFKCSQAFLHNADFEANRKDAYEIIVRAHDSTLGTMDEYQYRTMTYEEYMNAGDR